MAEGVELAQWLALRRAGLGSTSFSRIIAHFGSIAAAWEAPAEELGAAGLDAQYVRAFSRGRGEFRPEHELEQLDRHNVRALTWLDADYPEPLKNIPQSPPVLFVRGASGPAYLQTLAVVGTRRVTPYGRQACEEFCAAVARAGVAIVSGLARGVDTIAHRVALEHEAPTVAVLAGGIDAVFPRENAGLAERILAAGCLVSEYPVGVKTRPDYFPRRNRIVSGLSDATLVVEAGDGSGALHTANHAHEQNRDVFAVPGSVFSAQSRGTNQLIRESTAKLVATPEQLCEELNLIGIGGQLPLATSPPATPARATTAKEGQVLHCLEDGPQHIDEIVRRSGLGSGEVGGVLQILELDGFVREEGPLTYARSR